MRTLKSVITSVALLTVISCPLQALADYIPIAVSGFNQDVVVASSAVNDPTTHYTNAVTATMDGGTAKTGYTWFESGLPGGSGGGLPAPGVITSAVDPSAQFLLAPYTGPDVLLLNSSTTSGTLTFATPAAFSALSFLTSSGSAFFGTPVLMLTVNFADGTAPLSGLSVVSPDWFNNSPAAVIAQGRVDVGTGTFDQVGNDNPRIYQEDVMLPSSAWDHPISSITITWDSGGSNNSQTAIFAVSGMVPEPASVCMLGTGMLALAFGVWRTRRKAKDAR